jgi:NADH dehydrogenase
MRVLVTGGTGVIGEGLIPALINAGHEVRLLTRGAGRDAEEWPTGVEPFSADVSESESLKGVADDCEAVVHITGIVRESPPDATFERVNVLGTKNVLQEAERAGVARFIYVSSLGADSGRSLYHQSKRRAEEHVREFPGDWLILRPGGVYGPGDEVISTLLKLIRAVPFIPVVDSGDQRFQPIWFGDLGAAIAEAIEIQGLYGQTLELAGDEITTMNDIIDRLSAITGRTPAKIPVPSFIASLGTQLFEDSSLGAGIKRLTGLDVPVDEAKLTMLVEENFIQKPEENALVDVLGIAPLTLDEGLKALADLLPEQSLEDGVGHIERKRFQADIEGNRYSATELLAEFRERCMEIMPLEFQAEPGAASRVEKGATLTASIPLRGNIQIRVEELTARRITFVTLEGHPLAGVVQFKTSSLKSNGVRFMIEIHARDASLLDRLTMSAGGSLMQNMNWQEVVARVVEMSGGVASQGIESASVTLDEEEARRVEQRIEGLVKRYKRSMKAARAATDKRTRRPKASSKKGNWRSGLAASALSGPVHRKAAKASGTNGNGSRLSKGSSKKKDNSVESAGTQEIVETVSHAASSLVESCSSAAFKLTRAAAGKDAKRARR